MILLDYKKHALVGGFAPVNKNILHFIVEFVFNAVDLCVVTINQKSLDPERNA